MFNEFRPTSKTKKILNYLHRHPFSTIGDIASALSFSKAEVSGILNIARINRISGRILDDNNNEPIYRHYLLYNK